VTSAAPPRAEPRPETPDDHATHRRHGHDSGEPGELRSVPDRERHTAMNSGGEGLG
jgi:hypothetical protein